MAHHEVHFVNGTIRNRIVEHVVVPAGELVPHPLNFREHPDEQRQALEASYAEIGFARSLLGHRLPDGRIQLIDGHLRAGLDPAMPVTVEVLDVTEEEAKQLLLTIDPLASLAVANEETLRRLQDSVQSNQEALSQMWGAIGRTNERTRKELERQTKRPQQEAGAEQFLVILTCRDEREQVEMLRRFRSEGLECKATIA